MILVTMTTVEICSLFCTCWLWRMGKTTPSDFHRHMSKEEYIPIATVAFEISRTQASDDERHDIVEIDKLIQAGKNVGRTAHSLFIDRRFRGRMRQSNRKNKATHSEEKANVVKDFEP